MDRQALANAESEDFKLQNLGIVSFLKEGSLLCRDDLRVPHYT